MDKLAYSAGARRALFKLGFSPVNDIALPAAGGAIAGAIHGGVEDLPEGVDRLNQVRARALDGAITTPVYFGAMRGGARLGSRLSDAVGARYTTEPILQGLGGLGAVAGTSALSHLSGAEDKLNELVGMYVPYKTAGIGDFVRGKWNALGDWGYGKGYARAGHKLMRGPFGDRADRLDAALSAAGKVPGVDPELFHNLDFAAQRAVLEPLAAAAQRGGRIGANVAQYGTAGLGAAGLGGLGYGGYKLLQPEDGVESPSSDS